MYISLENLESKRIETGWKGVIEKEVIKQIKFMMPSSTGTVVK